MVTPNPTPIPGGDLSTTATGEYQLLFQHQLHHQE